MEQWLDIQTLIWLFPIMFIIHDMEEVIMVEKWLVKNGGIIRAKLPPKMANRILKQFSMSTAQFAVAVLVIFLFVSSSAYMAIQYLHNGPLASIHFFTVAITVYFLHAFTHIGQSIFFRTVTPGAITSIIVIIPYSFVLFDSLFNHQIITWNTVLVSFPFILLAIPIVLFAHWVGKKIG